MSINKRAHATATILLPVDNNFVPFGCTDELLFLAKMQQNYFIKIQNFPDTNAYPCLFMTKIKHRLNQHVTKIWCPKRGNGPKASAFVDRP